jgi:heat shock protein HtpX
MAAGMKGFQWWEPHDKARRLARLLFVLASGIVATYVIVLLAVALFCVWAAGLDTWETLTGWGDSLGVVGVVLCIVAIHAGIALLIVAIGWNGLPRATRRLSHARVPRPDEVAHAQAVVESAAIGVGIPAPRIWVIDEQAPNALTFGRARAGNVCLTNGALQLRHDEVDALCTAQVVMLAHHTFSEAAAAAALLNVARRLTSVLWSCAIFVFLSALIGVPVGAAAGVTLGIAVVVAVTVPIITIGFRVVPHLLDHVAELGDLDTANLTAHPEALAHLLLHLLENQSRVSSAPAISHLWFERDLVDDVTVRPGTLLLTWPRRVARVSHRSLAHRAETAVELASGDSKLRARLERAQSLAS